MWASRVGKAAGGGQRIVKGCIWGIRLIKKKEKSISCSPSLGPSRKLLTWEKKRKRCGVSDRTQGSLYLECSLQSPRPIMELRNSQESTTDQRKGSTERLKGREWRPLLRNKLEALGSAKMKSGQGGHKIKLCSLMKALRGALIWPKHWTLYLLAKGCGERGALVHCWWACKLAQLLCPISWWRFLRKLKIELPYNSAVALLGIYPKEYKNADSKHMHPNVYSSIINNSQTMERAQMSLD